MRRALLTVGLVLLTGLVVTAAGIKIRSAQAVNGAAVVTGRADKGVPIFWEGSRVATADGKGEFSSSGLIPLDCIGKLSDGTTTVNVSIKS